MISSEQNKIKRKKIKNMLTKQTPVTETVSLTIDNLPLGLIIAEDGRTLLVTGEVNSLMLINYLTAL